MFEIYTANSWGMREQKEYRAAKKKKIEELKEITNKKLSRLLSHQKLNESQYTKNHVINLSRCLSLRM
jgi:hypothetical protein